MHDLSYIVDFRRFENITFFCAKININLLKLYFCGFITPKKIQTTLFARRSRAQYPKIAYGPNC